MKPLGEHFFVDTNVIANYILIKKILKKSDRKKFLLYDKLKPSIDLIGNYFEKKRI